MKMITVKALSVAFISVAAILSIVYGVTIFINVGSSKPYSDEIFMASLIREHGGFFEGFSYWFNNYSSMPVKDFMQFLLVGLPNAYLDWDYVNIIGLTVPLAFMAAAIIYLFSSITHLKLNIFKSLAILFVIVFAFMIAPTFGVEIFKYFDFTENKSSYYYWNFVNISWLWSAASVNYTLTIALLILMFTYLINNPNMRYKYLYFIALGVFVGFGNPNTTLIVCSMLAIVIFSSKYFSQLSIISWKSSSVIIITAIASLSLSFIFPGNIQRSSTSDHLIAAYEETFLSGMVKDAFFLLSPGFYLIPLVSGILIFNIMQFKNKSTIRNMNNLLPTAFLFAGILAFTVNNIIAIPLYKALWHQMNPQILLIISGILFGYRIAEWSQEHLESRNISLTLSMSALLVVAFASSNVYTLNNYIEERNQSWWNQYSTHIRCGDVPYFWNYNAYETLAKYRDSPELTREAVDSKNCDSSSMFT